MVSCQEWAAKFSRCGGLKELAQVLVKVRWDGPGSRNLEVRKALYRWMYRRNL